MTKYSRWGSMFWWRLQEKTLSVFPIQWQQFPRELQHRCSLAALDECIINSDHKVCGCLLVDSISVGSTTLALQPLSVYDRLGSSAMPFATVDIEVCTVHQNPVAGAQSGYARNTHPIRTPGSDPARYHVSCDMSCTHPESQSTLIVVLAINSGICEWQAAVLQDLELHLEAALNQFFSTWHGVGFQGTGLSMESVAGKPMDGVVLIRVQCYDAWCD